MLKYLKPPLDTNAEYLNTQHEGTRKPVTGEDHIRSQQEREAPIGTGSPKWKIGKTLPVLTSLDFSYNIQMAAVEFDVNNRKAWIHTSGLGCCCSH